MADLIAIGYPDETTALSAMDETERLQHELIIQADAVAAIIRNKKGKIRVVTNHHAVGAGATWGMFWACCSACCSSSRSWAWPSGRGWAR
jgi:uncharacterized membrane protein